MTRLKATFLVFSSLLISFFAVGIQSAYAGYGQWGTDPAFSSGSIQEVPAGDALTAIGYGSADPDCVIRIRTAPVNPDGSVDFSQADTTWRNTVCGNNGDKVPDSHHAAAEKYFNPITGYVVTGWSWGAYTHGGVPFGTTESWVPQLECYYQEYMNLQTKQVYQYGSPYTGTCQDRGYTPGMMQAVARAPAGRVIIGIDFMIGNNNSLNFLAINDEAAPTPAKPVLDTYVNGQDESVSNREVDFDSNLQPQQEVTIVNNGNANSTLCYRAVANKDWIDASQLNNCPGGTGGLPAGQSESIANKIVINANSSSLVPGDNDATITFTGFEQTNPSIQADNPNHYSNTINVKVSKIAPGQCGTADSTVNPGKTFSSTPPDSQTTLCAPNGGTPTPLGTPSNGAWTWTCSGNPPSRQCSANAAATTITLTANQVPGGIVNYSGSQTINVTQGGSVNWNVDTNPEGLPFSWNVTDSNGNQIYSSFNGVDSGLVTPWAGTYYYSTPGTYKINATASSGSNPATSNILTVNVVSPTPPSCSAGQVLDSSGNCVPITSPSGCGPQPINACTTWPATPSCTVGQPASSSCSCSAVTVDPSTGQSICTSPGMAIPAGTQCGGYIQCNATPPPPSSGGILTASVGNNSSIVYHPAANVDVCHGTGDDESCNSQWVAAYNEYTSWGAYGNPVSGPSPAHVRLHFLVQQPLFNPFVLSGTYNQLSWGNEVQISCLNDGNWNYTVDSGTLIKQFPFGNDVASYDGCDYPSDGTYTAAARIVIGPSYVQGTSGTTELYRTTAVIHVGSGDLTASTPSVTFANSGNTAVSSISGAVSNIGSMDVTSPFSNILQISAGNTGTATYTVQSSLNSLASGASTNLNFTSPTAGGNLPSLAPGNYGTRICAGFNPDGTDSIIETNTGNNCSGWVPFTVNAPANPNQCPNGSVSVSPSTIPLNGSGTASAPGGFSGGRFSSDNPGVASVSGNRITGQSQGTANITGSGWNYASGATNCSLSSSGGSSGNVTVTGASVNGACGTANKTYPAGSTSYGSDSYCSSGNPNSTPAFPSPGSSVHWFCNGLNSGQTSPQCTATVPVQGFSVTITRIPVNSQGLVTSSPSGLSCGNICSVSFSQNSTVTLTASPSSSYWQFSNWGGDCSGTGTQCTLNVNAAKNVTATFVPRNFNYQEF